MFRNNRMEAHTKSTTDKYVTEILIAENKTVAGETAGHSCMK